jgi:quercetin dioxygenase-like cupin family protein
MRLQEPTVLSEDDARICRSEVLAMQKHNLNVLIEYDDERFNPKVLMNEPGYNMVLLSMRAGQLIPEHASKGTVTVQAIRGHVTLFAESCPNELYAGEVICLESGVPHRIEAIEDSALLVLSTGGSDSSMAHSEELDLAHVPRPERHPRGGGLPSSESSRVRVSYTEAPFSATTPRSSLAEKGEILMVTVE